MIALKVFRGLQIKNFVSHLSSFRINLFREFPYLYVGNMEYETHYLKEYIEEPNAILSLVYADDEIVGMFSGMPLDSESSIVHDAKEAMLTKGVTNVNQYYYYAEVLVAPKFRGLGLSNLLCLSLDYEARSMGFTEACILTVEREYDHPLKPAGYSSTDGLWSKNGYKKNGIIVEYNWPTIFANGEVHDVPNKMALWEKPIVLEAEPNFDQVINDIQQKISEKKTRTAPLEIATTIDFSHEGGISSALQTCDSSFFAFAPLKLEVTDCTKTSSTNGVMSPEVSNPSFTR